MVESIIALAFTLRFLYIIIFAITLYTLYVTRDFFTDNKFIDFFMVAICLLIIHRVIDTFSDYISDEYILTIIQAVILPSIMVMVALLVYCASKNFYALCVGSSISPNSRKAHMKKEQKKSVKVKDWEPASSVLSDDDSFY